VLIVDHEEGDLAAGLSKDNGPQKLLF